MFCVVNYTIFPLFPSCKRFSVKLTRSFRLFCRRGSVVAIFNLTFTRDIADGLGDNVTSNLAVAVKSGSLGGLAVDPASLNVTKVGE